MPVSFIPSAEQAETRQKQTARKRRRNQNSEIDDLAALLPIKQPSTIANGILARGRTQSVDKISVLRLTSAFLKFQQYMENDQQKKKGQSLKTGITSTTSLLSEALDGFILVLDKEGTILYASDSITDIVGLTQHDVIGQNLSDITEEEDLSTITKNLLPKTTPPATHLDGRTELQQKEFYVRIKSSVAPGQMQLSRFKSHIMIQISGNLKVHVPFQSHMNPKQNGIETEPQVLGFVGECRPIESTSSILEVSVPQSHFTSTISLDMKIISVEASVKEVVGYDPGDFVGTRMSDYFHPGDCKKMIPCEKTLLRLGHAVSPVFRFISSSGEWVWMQLEGMLRFKAGGIEPQFWEVKAKLLSQEDGRMKYIEYREMYAKNCDPNQDLLSPHKDPAVTACLMDSENRCRKEEGAAPIIGSLKEAQVCMSLIDSVLHGREVGLSTLPGKVKRVLTENTADDFVIQRNKKYGWPIPANLQERAKVLEQMASNIKENGRPDQAVAMSATDSAPPQQNDLHTAFVSALPSNQINQQDGYLGKASIVTDIHSPSSVGDSPVGSGLDGYTLSRSHPFPSSHLHTLTASHSLGSPPDSVQLFDTHSSNPSPLSTAVMTPPPITSNNLTSNGFTASNQPLVPPFVDQSNSLPQVEQISSDGFDFTPFAQNVSGEADFFPQNFSNSSLDSFNSLSTPSQLPPAHPITYPQQSNSIHSYASSQNGVHDVTVSNHPLSKTTSVSSLASSVASPQNPSEFSSPHPSHNTPLTSDQPYQIPDTQCLEHILSEADHTPVSPEQVFLSTANDSLEQILNDMISLNKVGGAGGRISVECEVHTDSGVRGMEGVTGFAVGSNEAEDVIQQFLS